jgi:predicted nucleic acid-binding protein
VTTLVLDASVAVKWSQPGANEPLIREAIRLFERYSEGEINFLVPDIFWPEVGNVFWKWARRGLWTPKDAEATLAEFIVRDFITVRSIALLSEALNIAISYDRTINDSLYAALAVQSRTHLITADERLANALAARFPVKWLGAF